MAFTRSIRSHSLNQPSPVAEKISGDPITSKTAQSTVTCVYTVSIAGLFRKVTILWCKNLMNHSMSISVHSLEGHEFHNSCKIDLKPWQFWSKKGYRSMEIDGNHAEIFWDVRSAKFSNNCPEPSSDFYVALVCDEEVVLLLGDCKKKAYKRTKSRPALSDPVLFYKKENVFAKKCFSTRARFDLERRKEHDIVVESSTSGPKDPEMWISVDGLVLIHIKNLQWKFRGNQTVMVNKLPVQVFWDVHDWLFSSEPGTGHGFFIFKPGSPPESESDRDESGHGGMDSDTGSAYYSTRSSSNGTSQDYCLFLHCWKLD